MILSIYIEVKQDINLNRPIQLYDEEYLQLLNMDVMHNRNQNITSNILDVHAIKNLITTSMVNLPTPQDQYQRIYSHPITQYIKLDIDNIDNFQNIQLILALYKEIPIVIVNPCKIYWNGWVYKEVSKKGNYRCSKCPYKIKLHNDVIYTKQNDTMQSLDYNHLLCMEPSYKQNLIYLLMKRELILTIKAYKDQDLVKIRQYYDLLISKYQYRLPKLDLEMFEPFKYMEQTLRANKGVTRPNNAENLKHYFKQEFQKTIQHFISSQHYTDFYMNDLLYKLNDNNVLISNKRLLSILFKSVVMGSDGTFNIIPKFKHKDNNKIRYRCQHHQIFKIYGMHQYLDKHKKKITVSYLIAMAILTSKERELYEWVNNCLLTWGEKLNLLKNCKLKEFICDFEYTQRAAATIMIDKLEMKQIGEEFHYTKAIHHHVRECGFQSIYQKGKNRPNYDETFRYLISQFYTLAHIPATHVKEYALKCCIEVLNHLKYIYEKNDEVYYNGLKFCIYFLKNWAEYTRDDIIKALSLNNSMQNHFRSKLGSNKSTSWKILEWNLFKKSIRTSNMIESYNKNHRMHIGCYFPDINKLINWFLCNMENTIREYNADQERMHEKGFIRSNFQNPLLKKKNNLLSESQNTLMTWEKFKILSAELCKVRKSICYGSKQGNDTSIAERVRNNDREHRTTANLLSAHNVSYYTEINSSDSQGYVTLQEGRKRLKTEE